MNKFAPYEWNGRFGTSMEEGAKGSFDQVFRRYDDAESATHLGEDRVDIEETRIDRTRTDVGDDNAFLTQFHMECTREIGEESFGGAIGGQSLYGNGGGDGAYVEDIALMAADHVLPEIVAKHGGGVHVQVEDERVETYAFIEEIAVVIDACIIDEHLYFELVRLAVVVELFGCIGEGQVALETDDLDGVGCAEDSGLVVNSGFVAYDE